MVPADVDFLAGLFAFGAMLAFTLAHLSVIVLRFREPGRRRTFRVPLSVPVGRGSIPLPSALGALMAAAGLGQRRGAARGRTDRRQRVAGVGDPALRRLPARRGQVADAPLHDPRGGAAGGLGRGRVRQHPRAGVRPGARRRHHRHRGPPGRRAGGEGEGGAVLEALYVFEIPMSLPIDARVPEERVTGAQGAARAPRRSARSTRAWRWRPRWCAAAAPAQAIVSEARAAASRRSCSRPRSRRRISGGAHARRPRPRARPFAGETTRYVVEKAPCKVILTAPPANGEGAAAHGEARRSEATAPAERLRVALSLVCAHVRPDRRLRAGRLGDRQVDAGRGPRGLRARRGPRGDRAAQPRARPTAGRTWAAASRSARRSRSTRSRRPASSSADAFVASTDGDNTNLVIAQIAKRRFDVERVVVRVLDPARASGTPSRACRRSAPPRPRSSCSRPPCEARSASKGYRAKTCTY